MRCEAGQGTVEYVGILALLAVVLAAAVAGSAVLAPGVANAVTGGIRHALCVVTGRVCVVVAQRPCVVRTARDERRETVAIAFVEIGAGRIVLRERLSDGTLRLTVLHRGEAGVTAGFGSSSGVRVGRVSLAVGAHAQATVAGIVGAGQVFEVRTAAQADAIVRRLRAEGSAAVDTVRRLLRRGDGDLPRADVSFVEGGVAGRLDATLSGEDVAGAGASGGGDSVLGRRVDRRTGETTWYLRLDRSLPVFADAMLGSAAAGLDGDALLAVTTDRSGRAVELSALVGGRAEAGAQVTGLGEAAAGGTRWEAEARVSLEDPEVRAALAAWRRSPMSVEAIRGLGETLRDRARLDVRRYARSATSDSDGASVSAGVRLGAHVAREQESTRLLTAATRPPGGLWEPRVDCVDSAA